MSDLWLHGFTGSPASFDGLAAALPDVTASRPFLAGHGPSPIAASTFEAEVARLAALARAAGAGRVLGYSLGARLALAIALTEPASVRSLVLVGATAGLHDADARRARREADDGLAAFLEREGLEAFADRWEAQPLFASQAELPEALRRARQRERRAHEPAALAASLRALSKGRMPSFWSQLSSLRMPVALVVGARDTPFVAEAERMAALLPHARLHVVPGVGHDVVLERPAALAALLRSGEGA